MRDRRYAESRRSQADWPHLDFPSAVINLLHADESTEATTVLTCPMIPSLDGPL